MKSNLNFFQLNDESKKQLVVCKQYTLCIRQNYRNLTFMGYPKKKKKLRDLEIEVLSHPTHSLFQRTWHIFKTKYSQNKIIICKAFISAIKV